MFGTYWYGLELPRHLFHFSPRSLRRAIESTGLTEGYIATQPSSYAEYSARYIIEEALTRLGASPKPLAKASPSGNIPWRIIRKVLRLSLVAPFARLASIAGASGSMEAVLVKPTPE
jgi:hypothetical protein